MKALIVYESMFGNTRRIAEAIAAALDSAGVTATATIAADAADLTDYDLVIVGAPTHAHTLPQPSSRSEAVRWADEPGKSLQIEARADEAGVREWLERVPLPDPGPRFAAFSTRADFPRIFAGDAAVAIKRRLHKRGVEVEARRDFLVDMESHLVEGQEQLARDWAMQFVPVAAR